LTFGGTSAAPGKDWIACTGFVTGLSFETGDMGGGEAASGSITIKLTGIGTYGTTA
jgi:hypothetical protein